MPTLRAVLPRGGVLPDHRWRQRHHAICTLLWLHVVVLPVLAVTQGASVVHALSEIAVVAGCAAAAQTSVLHRTLRASLATLGLLSSSAVLVHLYEGLIEMHFHFFFTIAVISLYQAWTPYLIGVGFVVLHHAVIGVMAAQSVYNHPAAQRNPAGFALLHGGFILAESLACLTYWRLTEDALDAERKQRSDAEASNEALSRANRQVSDLVAMLSHDLRTPLTVINGYAALTLQRWPELDERQRRGFVERVGRAGHVLQELLDDTLTASAFDAGGVQPRPRTVDVGAVVRDVLDTLAHPLPGLQLVVPEGSPAAYVDRGHLKQVLSNVVSNAAKYGAAPYRIDVVSEPDAVVLRMIDHGAGVPSEFAPHVFERYSRSEAARKGSLAGTGLGLFIARELLHANGGDISYERHAGGGAAFLLRLPRVPGDGDDPHRPSAAAHGGDPEGTGRLLHHS